MGAKALDRSMHFCLRSYKEALVTGVEGLRGRLTGEMTTSRSEKCYGGKHSRVKGGEGSDCSYKEVRKLEYGRSAHSCQ